MSKLPITKADSHGFFEVRKGEIIEIRLEENPSTGYQWAIDQLGGGILILQESDFIRAEGPALGRGGIRTFSFKAEKTGRTKILLKHWREWEGGASIIDRFELTISATD